MVEDSEKRLEDLIIKMTSLSSGAAKVDDLDDDELDKDKVDEDELGEDGLPKTKPSSKKNENSGTSSAPPPPGANPFNYMYNNAPNVQHPHVNNLGAPPLVDRTRFTNWKASMKSYVCSSSMQIWRIIEMGYSPKDPKNLSSSDLIDQQLNAHAMHMLERAMANEGVEQIGRASCRERV